MKISSLKIFGNNSKTAQTSSYKESSTQVNTKNKELNLNEIANSYPINFKSSKFFEVTPQELRIDDITNFKGDNMHIKMEDLPKDKDHLNANGLNIKRERGQETTKFTISNDNGNILFIATIKNNTEMPKLTYKQGKFMPEITVKHPSLDQSRVKMLAGSEIISNDFSLIMPGEIYETNGNVKHVEHSHGISFKGSVAISTLNLEEKTKNAVDLYMNSDLPQKTTKGAFTEDVEKYDPLLTIPAGGFGERFYNFTRNNENKPSFFLPTSPEYRIIGTTLNMAAAAGIIKGNNQEKITYLSQNNQINGDNVVHVGKIKSDGGAIVEGIENGTLQKDKDLIILNADIFTNADITRPYHALKTLPDAALVIPYYPVPESRAKSLGLLGCEIDENGNTQIKTFVEKPSYISEAPKSPQPNDFADEEYDAAMKRYIQNKEKYDKAKLAKAPDSDLYYANPGMYFMSKEAVEILAKMKNKAGLGADVMPKIVELCQQGKLKNAEGKPMKVYTVPLQRADGKVAFWDDIGTAEAYLKVIKNVAHETKNKGTGVENKFYGVPEFVLNDFMDNVDEETSIVYQSQTARKDFKKFKEKFNITKAEGNIFVAA